MKKAALTIAARLAIAFILLNLLILVVGMVALSQIRVLAGLANDMYIHPLTVGYTMRDIRSDIDAMHDLMQKIPFIGDSVELSELESKVNEMETRVFGKFDLVRERFLGEKNDVEVALRAFTDWKRLRDEAFKLARDEARNRMDASLQVAQQKYVDDLKVKTRVMIDFAAGKAASFLDNANEEKANAGRTMVLFIGAALLAGLCAAFFITRSITVPLRIIVRRMRDIAGGDMRHDIDIVRRDEIGELADSFREMQGSLRNKADVAMAIASGDFERVVEIRGRYDQLGTAINEMMVALRSSKRSSELQDWIKTGKNELNRIIVGETDINRLAGNIIGFLAGYLKTQIGTFYVMSDRGGLTLHGSYAFSKRKSLAASIEPGEGLVGQACVEKSLISITNIPEDYLRISSSLGDSPPRNLAALPFLYENTVKGVIELGSFEELSDNKLDFLRDIADYLGIAIHTVQSQIKLRELLEETQRQSRQLQIQEEELRASNEELEEQTGALRQSEVQLKQQQEELQSINEELEEKNQYLEKQRELIAQKNKDLEEVRQELERRARELELTSKYKSEFLANMSHELRTPLNSLLILSRDLADNGRGNLSPDQVEASTIIHKSGVDLLELINEILDLSKIEAGRMTLKVSEILLEDLAQSLDRSFKHVALDKGVSFNVVVSDGLPESIRSDVQRLEQILKNFISNALKFTEKGAVTVSFGRPSPSVALTRGGLDLRRALAFSVSDTGIGIPEDKQLLIFDPFQQADGGAARRFGGVGLGLSISRELARLLGGEIQLVSRLGEGSTFTLYLPEETVLEASDQKPPAAIRTPFAKPAPAASVDNAVTRVEDYMDIFSILSIPDDRNAVQEGEKCILIIEDDEGFAKILLNQCHAKGFKALASATGEAGLELAEKYLPDAVILDIKLPGMNGWTVLNALKTNPSTRHIPVHIMSVEEGSLDALQKGAIGFLTKPVDRVGLEDAFKRIEEVVEKKIKDLLIVEDNAALRLGIVNLIGDADVNIVEVETGEGAFSALRETSFDCMVLDLGLPDMTGFELLSGLAAESTVHMPPVIVYTGKDLTREEEMELRKHAESIIIKGARSEERLLDEVALFLHKMVSAMPPRKREMIINLHDRDAMFAGKSVLIVDDDMRNLFALSKILSDKGMKVLKAEDGKKALAVLEEQAGIDLVLLDIMMPVMDGYETAREIRSRRKFSNLPIIALTAKAMRDDREKCIAAGASDYLSKPVDVDRLLSMLRVWLYRRPEIV